MERFFKLVRRFFPNRFRETKEQKLLGEWTLPLGGTKARPETCKVNNNKLD
jgi:hypothetical protein